MMEAISLINVRLQDVGCVSNATIATILFMAKAEVCCHFLFVLRVNFGTIVYATEL